MKRYRTGSQHLHRQPSKPSVFKKVILKTFLCIALLVGITLGQGFVTPFGVSVNQVVKQQLNQTTNVKDLVDKTMVLFEKIK